MAASEHRRRDVLILSRVRRLQRRINLEVLLREAVVPAWCAATAIAVGWLWLRVVWPVALVAACGASAVWLYRARGRRLSLAQAAVLADRQLGLGGLLLTRLEVPVGAWELGVNQAIRQLRPPPIRVGRSAGMLLLAGMFLASALLVPRPEVKVKGANAAAATQVEELERKREALVGEEALDRSLEEELARLRQELAEGQFDAADWEAADEVDSALEQKAVEAAAELAQAAEAARALEEALARAQNADAAEREREALERALLELSDNAGDMGANGADGAQEARSASTDSGRAETAQGEQGQSAPGPSGGEEGQASTGSARAEEHPFRPSGVEAQRASTGSARTDGLTRAQASELRKALEQRQDRLARAFGQQSGRGREGAEGSPRRADGTQNRRGSGGAQGEAGEAQGSGLQQSGGTEHASRQVGEAGTARGGGAGELVFGGEAQMNPERLELAPLPEGNGGEPGELWGLRSADPRLRGAPTAAPATGSPAEGEVGPAHPEQPLLPRNRELVRRYFDTAR